LSFDKSVNQVWHRISAVFRRRRRKRFLALFPPDVYQSVIDLGGLVKEWEDDPRKVTILNLMSQENSHCEVVVGDGRQTGFPDGAFDLAYSNSTIEHVGPVGFSQRDVPCRESNILPNA